MSFIREEAREIAAQSFDVVIAGGGTAGVIAAIASARQGARTALVESKGYVGGIAVEGGTALHSFYNLWKAFPGVPKRQVVRGIPLELVDRLAARGGTTGHAEMTRGFDYDSVCTAIDVEVYKLVAHEMLVETGVQVMLNSFVASALVQDGTIKAAIAETHAGRTALLANAFVDCTGYADLAGKAGARCTEPNDYPVANSIGVGGVNIEAYTRYIEQHDAVSQFARGRRSGRDEQIVRVDADNRKLPADFVQEMNKIGMSTVITSTHDAYFMFLKLNVKLPISPTDRDAASAGELELRRRQARAIELLRQYIPGCEKAFIARSSPSLCIRRGRLVECDYDITSEDVLQARHFEDDVMVYGFHDYAPRLQIRNGGTYGIPYCALRVRGLENLLVAGMMITSNHDAHMSTRNTVCCMGQGQAAGTAAALCAQRKCSTRELPYQVLRDALLKAGVCLDP